MAAYLENFNLHGQTIFLDFLHEVSQLLIFFEWKGSDDSEESSEEESSEEESEDDKKKAKKDTKKVESM